MYHIIFFILYLSKVVLVIYIVTFNVYGRVCIIYSDAHANTKHTHTHE